MPLGQRVSPSLRRHTPDFSASIPGVSLCRPRGVALPLRAIGRRRTDGAPRGAAAARWRQLAGEGMRAHERRWWLLLHMLAVH